MSKKGVNEEYKSFLSSLAYFPGFLTACLFFAVNKRHLFPAKLIDYFLQSDFIQPRVYQDNILRADLGL